MRPLYRTLAAFCLIGTATMSTHHSSGAALSVSSGGSHDFDFLFGEWRVRHRILRAAAHEWVEFEGTSTTRPLMDPAGPIDPPVRGHFENGVGNFYSDGIQQGKPIRTRYTWSHITAKSARWEQATSPDSGRSWDPNWTMEFSRMK